MALTQNTITQADAATKRGTEESALPVLQKRLDAMPALQKLADSLHLRAAADFRVYYQIGNREVELFAAESISSWPADHGGVESLSGS